VPVADQIITERSRRLKASVANRQNLQITAFCKLQWTAAPMVVCKLVITGIAGGDDGERGLSGPISSKQAKDLSPGPCPRPAPKPGA
jgi:hypothetical protein